MRPLILIFTLLLNTLTFAQQQANTTHPPSLQKQGTATQLIVAGKPFLILGGELGNSSASTMAYMKPVWPTLVEMHLNTLLAPVYWELLEPQEGKFDFTLVDSLILQARANRLKLVLLWFGSWKNSMSCYVPAWVKTDSKRFPRAQDQQGRSQEILTPFNKNNLETDIRAFTAFMTHLKEIDSYQQTVLMIQVENEIGMLPEARDYHPAATQAFQQAVPQALIQYIQVHQAQLIPGVLEAWKTNGSKTRGNWEEVFGKGLQTDEMFMAWYFAQYANQVTQAGKNAYPLPMFVNAALNRPHVKPGGYPSGGPLPHLMDIWKAAAPEIDFLSPDFYNPDFKHWNDLYSRPDNPLFIPEIRFEPSVAAKVFYAIGHYGSLGFSPFSIESTDHPKQEPITRSYEVLAQLSPIILTNQGNGAMEGVLFDKTNSNIEIKLGEYTFTFKHDYTLGWSPKAKEETWPITGGIIIQTGKDEFLVAGTGIVVSFSSLNPRAPIAGILAMEEGQFIQGKWVAGRKMNGDQNHQGRHLRFPVDEYGIQKLKLYQYK